METSGQTKYTICKGIMVIWTNRILYIKFHIYCLSYILFINLVSILYRRFYDNKKKNMQMEKKLFN